MCGLASDGILTIYMVILKCNHISIDAYIATCIAFPSHLSARTIMLRGISQLAITELEEPLIPEEH